MLKILTSINTSKNTAKTITSWSDSPLSDYSEKHNSEYSLQKHIKIKNALVELSLRYIKPTK